MQGQDAPRTLSKLWDLGYLFQSPLVHSELKGCSPTRKMVGRIPEELDKPWKSYGLEAQVLLSSHWDKNIFKKSYHYFFCKSHSFSEAQVSPR